MTIAEAHSPTPYQYCYSTA